MEEITLTWRGEGLRFDAERGGVRSAIDGDGDAALSPVALLVASLAACSAADVVDILRKGRQDVRGLEVSTRAERRVDPPRRLTRVEMEFRVYGDVDPKKAERAVALSFEKYCSVYHSLRDDIALEWTVSVVAAGPDPSP